MHCYPWWSGGGGDEVAGNDGDLCCHHFVDWQPAAGALASLFKWTTTRHSSLVNTHRTKITTHTSTNTETTVKYRHMTNNTYTTQKYKCNLTYKWKCRYIVQVYHWYNTKTLAKLGCQGTFALLQYFCVSEGDVICKTNKAVHQVLVSTKRSHI